MRIQHNIMAMNAYRNYTNNVSAMKSNLEKLSSGYKINRAGDDAAGLAISEKMRAQITGLETAQKNAKDGISLVQTAEGALTEVHDMLNRMVELATQSANGTYDNTTDRAQLQKEVEQLKDEINRIADSANFNGIQLLDGSMAISEAVEGSVTNEELLVSGMDRIIQTVKDAGEKAYDVQGKKTILDSTSTATSAVKASFSLDLSTLNFTVSGTKAGTVEFDLKIGGVKISAKATGVKASMSSASVAKLLSSAVAKAIQSGTIDSGIKGVASKSIRINNVDWTVKASNGKLTFTQVNAPKNADEARANFDVNLSFKDNGGTDALNIKGNVQGENAPAKTSIDISGSTNSGTYVGKAGVSLDDVNKANTVFNIREEDIQDGTQIAIGNKLITLKIGADSKVNAAEASAAAKAAGATSVIVTLDKGVDLNTALSKISNAVGSTVKLYRMGGADGKTLQTITFSLGVSDGANGNVIGLTLQRTQAITGASGVATNAFISVEELAKNFSMNVKKTTVVEAKEAQKGLTLQIGDTADKFNQLNVSIGDMHAAALGLDKISIADQDSAAKAIDAIKAAINQVSDVRGTLGATQNRLDHTINNLSVMTENIQDAESTIRDTDVADEMMAYTKNNILIQSAQAMLAQANQVPQGVLQLLQ